MSAAGGTLTRSWRGPATLFDDGACPESPQLRPARAGQGGNPPSDGSRLTLQGRIESVWEGLRAVGVAECPVCRARMELSGGVGDCNGCGSRLA